MERKNRIVLNWILILTLTMILFFFMAIMVSAIDENPQTYQEASFNEENGKVTYTEKTISSYTEVGADTIDWGETGKDTWYLVSHNITVNDRIEVNGTVNLILCDGVTLTASKGIRVDKEKKQGEMIYHTLNIYAQSYGSGKLEATGDYERAGIGGDYRGGNVNIHGGNIIANGGKYGSGIGGGSQYEGGNVTIYGGNVSAVGGMYASGIGGGSNGPGGSVTIYGGNVIANGGDNSIMTASAAGIGGGLGGNNGITPQPHGTLTVGNDMCVYGGNNENPTDIIEQSEGEYARFKYMVVKGLHVHSFDTAWSKDDSYHWHACIAEGHSDDCLNDADAEKGEHSYGDTGNARFTCSICGYEDTTRKAEADLADAKTDATGVLDNLLAGKNESDYDADDWAALTDAITEGKNGINDATSIEEVNTAKSNVINTVSEIKTREQKAADELTEAKTAAIGELDSLLAGKNQGDYDVSEWADILAEIESAKTEIENATSIDGVNAAKNSAVNTVAEIKTKAQKEAEKEAAEKEAADKKAAAAKAEADKKAAEFASNGYGYIDPTLPKVKIQKPKAAKKSLTAKWKKIKNKKQLKMIKGIEVEYSLTPDFQNPLFKSASKKKASVKIKKLLSKKTYYVRAHTYVKRNGVKYVSNWSVAKKVKVK